MTKHVERTDSAMPSLQKIVDGQPPETIPLAIGPLTIGRGHGSQLQLLSQLVSKQHARVTCTGSECVVEDLSMNGTLLNGRRIDPRQQVTLRHGDQIGVGPFLLIYLVTESPEDLSGTSGIRQKFAVMPAGTSEPDLSMRRKAVAAGDRVEPTEIYQSPALDPRKILHRIPLQELPLLQLSASDAVRRLSQLLRCVEIILPRITRTRIEQLLRLQHEFFPSADQIAVIRIESPALPWLVVATSCRAGEGRVLLCDPLIQHVAQTCEAVLVTDQWRGNDEDQPRLSDLNRCSAICVPLRDAAGQCQGMIQMTASSAVPAFTVEDLERLIVQSQVLALAYCRIGDVMFSNVKTIVTGGTGSTSGPLT